MTFINTSKKDTVCKTTGEIEMEDDSICRQVVFDVNGAV